MGGAINDQWSIGDPTFIGLAYAFPVGNRAAKANWRQAELRVAQFQREFDKVVADVVLEVRNAGHNIEFTGNQREATRSVAVLANRELSLLQTRTELLVDGADVGTLYLENLFDTQDRLAAAELGFIQSSADYALTQFELQRSTGTLLRSRPLPEEASAKPIWPHRQLNQPPH